MSAVGSVAGSRPDEGGAPSRAASGRSALFGGSRSGTPVEGKAPLFPRLKKTEFQPTTPTQDLERRNSMASRRSRTELPPRSPLAASQGSGNLGAAAQSTRSDIRRTGSFSSRASGPAAMSASASAAAGGGSATADSPRSDIQPQRKLVRLPSAGAASASSNDGTSPGIPAPATPLSVLRAELPPHQASPASAAAPLLPRTPSGTSLKPAGSHASAVQELERKASGGSVPHRGSGVSVVSLGGGSVPAATPAEPPMPPPPQAYADIPDAVSEASTHRSQGGGRGVDLHDENSQLRSQVESLQRLLHDQSKERKVVHLQRDVQSKAQLISKLEKERTSLNAEVMKLKLMKRSPSMRSSMRKSVPPAPEPVVEEQKQQQQRESMMTYETADHIAELQESVCTLRQTVAEKQVALKQTELKLEKAQDAIVAGINWEAPIKLSETKRALQAFLRSSSSSPAAALLPNHASTASARSRFSSAAVRSATTMPVTPSMLPQVRQVSQPLDARTASVTLLDSEGHRVTYISTPQGVVKVGPGGRSRPLHRITFVPQKGALSDVTGVTYLAQEAASAEALEMLASVADASGCSHNITQHDPRMPSPSPSLSLSPSRAVVAAHWLVEEKSRSPTRQTSLPPYPTDMSLAI